MSASKDSTTSISESTSYSDLPKIRSSDGSMHGAWWNRTSDSNRLVCQLCPRQCSLKPGDRGFCFVRENRDGEMVLSTYGRSTGFCIDPIEKKPLNHFFPGTAVLSFGTAGCNLGCKFCQNWDISKSREVERLSARAEPETVARAAVELGCHSVAFTYNDPIVWAEYAIDTAKACHAVGVQTVAVTAGYISTMARQEFFEHMDAANVDLKAFTEEFYNKITYSQLQPVLDTLVYLRRETNVWFEITNLVIPDANDSRDEIAQMCDYLVQEIGDDVPIHFSAFHPDFRMRDRGHTPPETLVAAYDIAKRAGLKYVYVGNVHDLERQSTVCPNCGQLLIARDWYQLGQYRLDRDLCSNCQTRIAGRFAEAPGTWGPKRQPIRIEQYSTSTSSIAPVRNSFHGLQQPMGTPTPKEPVMSTTDPILSSTMAPIPVQASLPKLSDDQKKRLHAAACTWVAEAAMHATRSTPESLLDDMAAMTVHGVFVTLKRGEQLRGCCGSLGQPMPLGPATAQSAFRTALEDQRLSPISPSELPYLDVDVTILGPMVPVAAEGEDRIRAIEVGRHGLVIQSGQSSGLLLPSVATEQGWNAEQFLQAACRKAGLPIDAWKRSGSVLLTFEGRPVGGPMIDQGWAEKDLAAKAPMTKEQLEDYVRLAAQNIAALAQGATPSYYAPQLPDLTVNAIVVSMMWGGDDSTRQGNALQMSVRPGVPLQSTLFQMCESVAQIFVQQRYTGRFHLGLSIGIDPALHGMGDHLEIEGLDSTRRAIVINDPRHCAIVFDPTRSPAELLDIARRNLPVGSRFGAVHSLQMMTTMPDLIAITVPQPSRGSGQRDPAVAGQFYPAEDAARRQLVDKLFKHEVSEKVDALAIMVPHAGLRYSGAVAAEVWQKVRIPKTVLVISPKHTAPGVNWSVSPFDGWRLSASTAFECDTELAAKLVEKVPGLVYDSGSHEREHGIEVQLPLLEKLAPKTRVVGVALHGGSWEEIDAAASGLADVIRSMDEPPLLVISSDMNHYAPDEENRRLDRMALDALKSCEPKTLLDTCRDNHISMCGVIPAALVLETIRKLEPHFHVEEVGYATSADAGADKNSVVGYAGALIRRS